MQALISLKKPNDPLTILQDALKYIDLGLLLGAPFKENQDLLTKSATMLSKELSQLYPEDKNLNTSHKRKSYCEYSSNFNTVPGQEICTLECPSLETFHNKHFVPQVPAKLQGNQMQV